MNIEYNTRGLLHAFFRQQVKVYLIVGLFLLLGLVMVGRVQPYYQAGGSMLVKFGQGAMPEVNMPDGARPNEVSRSDRAEIMASNLRILTSQSLLREVVSFIGVDKIYPPAPVEDADDEAAAGETVDPVRKEKQRLQSAIGRLLGGDLVVQTSGASNIIEVSVRSQDPEIAALLAGTLMDKFILRQAEVYSSAQTSFLDKQVAEMKAKRDQSWAEFSDFKEKVGISAIDEEMDQLLRQKSDLSTIAFHSVSDAQDTLAGLEAKEAEMRMTYNADSPLVKRLQESIAVAKRQLHERQAELNAASDIEEEGAAEGALSDKIAAIDERIAWLEAQRGLYKELEQRVEMDEENYRYYQQRGEEARINNLLKAENITRITIVDRPMVPLSPTSANKKLIMIAFLMAGLFLGVGLALVLELFDDRLTAPEQITQTTALPVFMSFEKIRGI